MICKISPFKEEIIANAQYFKLKKEFNKNL